MAEPPETPPAETIQPLAMDLTAEMTPTRLLARAMDLMTPPMAKRRNRPMPKVNRNPKEQRP